MAIAELCVTGKPTLFVPYPYAAEDHQTVNAMRLVEKHAGLIVKDEEVDAKLIPAILNLAMNREQQEVLQGNILKLAIKNADVIVAQKIIEQLKGI
jgi:UDP-N-acetylglucosamine--N-acetylmuramyl-(pentapeptide) pyrophosphoryl-undecaprenol N-acetylglucosamine transferase